jgi:hypothetical protein
LFHGDYLLVCGGDRYYFKEVFSLLNAEPGFSGKGFLCVEDIIGKVREG